VAADSEQPTRVHFSKHREAGLVERDWLALCHSIAGIERQTINDSHLKFAG
jgi:hypothetical protein